MPVTPVEILVTFVTHEYDLINSIFCSDESLGDKYGAYEYQLIQRELNKQDCREFNKIFGHPLEQDVLILPSCLMETI